MELIWRKIGADTWQTRAKSKQKVKDQQKCQYLIYCFPISLILSNISSNFLFLPMIIQPLELYYQRIYKIYCSKLKVIRKQIGQKGIFLLIPTLYVQYWGDLRITLTNWRISLYLTIFFTNNLFFWPINYYWR